MVMYKAATLILGASLLVSAESGLAARNRLYNARRHAEMAAKRDVTFAQIDARATESYGAEDPCGATYPAGSVAGFTTVTSYPVVFPMSLTVKPFISVTGCIELDNCENACVSDPANCLGIEYNSAINSAGVTEQSCNLLGLNYGGVSVTGQATSGDTISFVQSAGATNSGSTSDPSPLANHDQLPSCAVPLDNQNQDGLCSCGPGRTTAPGNDFLCESVGVEAGAYKTVEILSQAAQVYTPITISQPFVAAYSIMDANQCGAICDADTKCIGYYLELGSRSNDCYKIGASGSYLAPDSVGAPFTDSTVTTRRSKRDVGSTGTFAAGGVLGVTTNGGLLTSAAAAPTTAARLRSRRSAVNSQVQW